MMSYSAEVLQVDEIDDAAAETAANRYAYSLDKSGEFGKLTRAKTTVAENDAYQIYSRAKSDGKHLVAWLFAPEKADRVYLISAEGQRKDVLKLVPVIEESWSHECGLISV